MKIILLNPYYQYIDNFQGYMKHIGSVLPPLGLAILGGMIRNEGHQVFIIDGWVENLSRKKLIEKILSYNPDIIGIYTNTSSFYYTKRIIESLRILNENVILVAGGPHATVIPEKTMKDCPELDFIVIGEGEITFSNLIKALDNDSTQYTSQKINNIRMRFWNKKYKEIRGIAFRNSYDLNIIITEPANLIENLDDTPFPAWDLLELEKYKPSRANYYRLPSYTLMTSRGCPYNCSFCSKPMGKKVRFKSASRVFEEIKQLYDNYNAKEIIFEDDCFTLNKNRNNELFRLMRENKIDIKWSCLTRVDIINDDMLKKMKKNNCWRIGYGVESGNEEILSKMQKGFTKAKITEAFKITKKNKINIRAFFILGNLYDTQETIRQTIDFAKKLNPDLAQFSYFVPYPGTLDYNYAVSKKLIDPDYYLKNPLSDYHYLKKLVYIPFNLTESKLKYYQKVALREFYLRPRYILKQMKNLSNFDILRRNVEIAFELVLNLIRPNPASSEKLEIN